MFLYICTLLNISGPTSLNLSVRHEKITGTLGTELRIFSKLYEFQRLQDRLTSRQYVMPIDYVDFKNFFINCLKNEF